MATLSGFHAPVRDWFGERFSAPTPAQALCWPLIQTGENVLVLAPTGSGKTLAAFLWALDRLLFEPVPEPESRCRVLYVSPLKALAVDVERNLSAPLAGIRTAAERLAVPYSSPEIALRTGDTPARERARFSRHPADILITTPESLYLLLTTRARDRLRSVRTVIIDEIHALLGSKRGAHLALSLERLEQLRGAPLQRIGLSATVQPIEEAARFLGGYGGLDDTLDQPRPVLYADARGEKKLDLRVEVPVKDMAQPTAAGSEVQSIWPAMYPLLLGLIRAHRSTLIFVNSRRLTERLAGALNDLAGEEIVGAHHGSLAHDKRGDIEAALKAGALPALVATSSLEFGIDMGDIDLVVQIGAPPSVASGLQRIGRAGHHLGAASKGIILPKHRGELLACAALCARMREGAVEPSRYPRAPLDVLCQQIVAMVALEEWSVADLYACIRRAAPFFALSRPLFEAVLDLLSGRYPSDEFADLRPRLTWDRIQGSLRPRQGAGRLAVVSGGTIPDRGYFGVFLASGAKETAGGPAPKRTSLRVGELDEEMVFESRPGEIFVLGASSWRIEEITHDRVLVSPAPGQPGKMPFWRGEQAERKPGAGRAIGALSRTLLALSRPAALRRLTTAHALSPEAAKSVLDYLAEQAQKSTVPDDRTLVCERHPNEVGDERLCLLSPLGGSVHGPLSLCIEALYLRNQGQGKVDILWSDDGIVIRFPGGVAAPPLAALLPDPDEVEDLLAAQLGTSALLAGRFREAAARALLLPRRYPGQRAALWQTRRRAADLLRAASRFPQFPILLEAYRECLRDVFDVPALVDLLRALLRGEVQLVERRVERPSPFAASLLFGYAGNYLYEGDAPLQERRAQALLVDPERLRELIGSAALRDLIDPAALLELEEQLQHLAPERRARHLDGAHDLLLRLGDLSAAEFAARCDPTDEAAAFADALLQQGRALFLPVAGQQRLIAAEDAGRYLGALGGELAAGTRLSQSLCEPVSDPLLDLVSRYARSHGPFTQAEVSARFGLAVAALKPALAALVHRGRIVEGAFRPGDSGTELCDGEVLSRLRQRSLTRLRREIEPAAPEALARLYLAVQGIGARRSGEEALLQVIEQLQGLALPASMLETDILPARLSRYAPHDLDRLLSSGAVLWIGAEALGGRDGRVRLCLAGQAALLLPPRRSSTAETGASLPDKIRAHLRARGASFFPQILAACGGGFSQAVLSALWDLVWSGEVTNDTLQPLRAFLRASERRRPQRGSASRLGAHLPIPAEAGGRWGLVESALSPAPSETERAQALARQILARHGVLVREALTLEEVPGGFSALYPVLRAQEEAGQLRRGYFVAEQGAAQFALPGAAERLRGKKGAIPQVVVLAAVDPANAYGAALPWPPGPAGDGRRPQRAAGARVILIDGALATWLARGEQQLLTFPAAEAAAEAIARALASLVDGVRRRVLLLKEVNGRPTAESALAPALLSAGFRPGAQGFLLRAVSSA